MSKFFTITEKSENITYLYLNSLRFIVSLNRLGAVRVNKPKATEKEISSLASKWFAASNKRLKREMLVQKQLLYTIFFLKYLGLKHNNPLSIYRGLLFNT